MLAGVLKLAWICLLVLTLASFGAAQVEEYATALRLSRSTGDQEVIDRLLVLTAREPQFVQAHRALIAITRRAGQADRAERHFISLLESEATRAYAHYGLAAYYNTRQQHSDAEFHALECLKTMPDFLPAYGELARSARDPSIRAAITGWIQETIRLHPKAAGGYYAGGLIQSDLGEWTQATNLLIKADELKPNAFEILDGLFRVFHETYRSADTLGVLRRALTAARLQRNSEWEGIVLGRLGMVETDLGSYEAAQIDLKRAVEIMRDLGWAQIEQAYQANLGIASMNVGQYRDALEQFEEALAIARRTGDRQNEGRDIGLIATVHMEAADYTSAIRAFTQAAAIAREVGDRPSEADQTASLSLIYTALGENERALQLAYRALNIAREVKNPWLEGRFVEIIGFIQSSQGAHTRALVSFRHGLAIARRIGDQLGEASRLAYVSEVQARMGNQNTALRGLESALGLTRRIGALSIEGRILNDRGKILTEVGRPEEGLVSHRQALTAGETTDLPEVIWRAKAGAAVALEKLKRYSDAITHYKEAIETIESVRSLLPLPEDRVGFLETRAAVYANLIRLLVEMHGKEPQDRFDVEAFHIAERSRARALLEIVSEPSPRVPSQAAEDLLKAEARISQLQRELAREYARGNGATKIANLKTALGDAEDQHKEIRRELNEARSSSIRALEPAQVADLQRLLDPASALLLYVMGPDASHVFVVTSGRLAIARAPGIGQLAEHVRALRAAVSHRPIVTSAEAYIHHARVLHRALIEPVTPFLEGKTELLIAPDGPLHLLPFSLLLTSAPADSGPVDYRNLPFLIRKYKISTVPSASVFAALRKRKEMTKHGNGRALVLGDPVHSRGHSVIETDSAGRNTITGVFGRLAYSREEAESLGRLYPSGMRRILVGREATEENIKTDTGLSEYQIIHFAVHGVMNESRPQYSALVLSTPASGAQEDGLLYAHEISRLSLTAGLVGLSACNTALGKTANGEGLIGLTYAFISAGAKSVLASLWRVDDRSTAILMNRLYRTLLTTGESTTAALRRSQLRFISSAEYAHPYYWAGFAVFGVSDSLSVKSRSASRR